ncbi:MAG: type II toxin-antitoxin system RelE/ParE family toxin [Deltaproteobacteria bacterium]|nr:type II toxin-antitoxin system RelE/ParE family toxin [Deltaproteobacteria bacterium]
MLTLRLHPGAEEDLAAAVDWYESQEPGLGAVLLAEVDEVIWRLRRTELAGVVVPGVPRGAPFRRVLLDRFPYAVVFTADEHVLSVLAVAHHKRSPGYWRGRARQ